MIFLNKFLMVKKLNKWPQVIGDFYKLALIRTLKHAIY